MVAFSRRIPTSSNDVFSTTQNMTQDLPRQRQPSWHSDFCTVQHDHVRNRKSRPYKTQGQSRVKHNKICAKFFNHCVDALHHPWVRQQHRLTCSFNAIRLTRIKCRRICMWTCEDRKRVRRQSTPPFPQQRLNATDLRREIIGDKKMLHRPSRKVGRCSNSSRTIGSESS